MVRVAAPEPLPTRSQMRHTREPFLFYTLDIRNDHRHLRTTWSQSIAISCLLFAISSWWCPLSDWNDILSHQTIYYMLVQIYLTTWHSFIWNMEMLFMEGTLCICDNWWVTRRLVCYVHCDQLTLSLIMVSISNRKKVSTFMYGTTSVARLN